MINSRRIVVFMPPAPLIGAFNAVDLLLPPLALLPLFLHSFRRPICRAIMATASSPQRAHTECPANFSCNKWKCENQRKQRAHARVYACVCIGKLCAEAVIRWSCACFFFFFFRFYLRHAPHLIILTANRVW